MHARRRSISLPIVLASITIALCIVLIVAWILVTLQVKDPTQLVIGIVSLAVIMTVIVLFSVFLVREILESRKQDTFIASVTHELKSPLASIKLGLETLGRNNLPAGRAAELQSMMLEDVERLDSFIDDVLQASRLGVFGHPERLEDVDVQALVTRLITQLTRRYKLSARALEVAVVPGKLRTDLTALETLLKNLLDNAAKYAGDPPKIRLVAGPEADTWQFEVTNNGVGATTLHLKRIFERFYRVPSEEVRSRRGTGLGLYVASSLARSLGGSLKAESEGPNRGMTMRLRLPAHHGSNP